MTGSLGLGAGQKAGPIAHHTHACRHVADRHAMMNRCFAGALLEPEINIQGAHFQFERGGDAVHGLESVVEGLMGMLMQVDKSGGHHVAVGFEDAFAL